MAGDFDRSAAVISREDLAALLDAVRARGFTVVGPTVRDGAIELAELASVEDLPAGWGDEQGPGTYRLHRRDDGRLFGWAVGPGSPRRFLDPPEERLWSATGHDGDATITPEPLPARKLAFVGVRPCELAAIAIQDRVFVDTATPDRAYAARRDGALVIAVDCCEPSAVCFCASLDTGPDTRAGYDLALTELDDAGGHRFVVRTGSARGAELLADVPHRRAVARDLEAVEDALASARARLRRRVDTDDLPGVLRRTIESPRWDDVADRCLLCANCTLVCPTCFCSDWVEVSDLTGEHVERWRRWASCFTLELSSVHSGPIRASARSRYRQWLTHKLGTWWEQFGTSGCVGCGRCITWCPVGIDLTEELRELRALDEATEPAR